MKFNGFYLDFLYYYKNSFFSFISNINLFILSLINLLLFTTSTFCGACKSWIDVSITIEQKAYVSKNDGIFAGIAPKSLNIKFHHSQYFKYQRVWSNFLPYIFEFKQNGLNHVNTISLVIVIVHFNQNQI